MTKVCQDCELGLPPSAFNRDRRYPDGLMRRCRRCMASRGAGWRSTNKEHIAKKNREYRESHPGLWAKYCTPELRERQRVKMAAVRAANPDHWKDYYRRNYRRFLDQCHKRRARIGTGRFTEAEWLALLEVFDHRCAYCFAQKPLTIDHFTPLSRGGTHSVENIVPACDRCNKSKGARLVFGWLPRMQRAA